MRTTDAERRLAEIRAAAAKRVARHSDRMKAAGYKRKLFWLTDEECKKLQQRLDEIRAHVGDSTPDATDHYQSE